MNLPSADGFLNPRSAGSQTQKENRTDSLLDQESVKDNEDWHLSPLSVILNLYPDAADVREAELVALLQSAE